MTTLASNAPKKERVKMSFYIYLLLAFGLGLMLRPIFVADRPRDLHDDDFDRRFFRDQYD
jgi:hypothetical protein